MLTFIGIFVLGAAFGSFANVCIYRIPLGISIAFPRRSFCPWCHTQLSWSDNMPLLSFWIRRARCSTCRSRISSRYFFVELLVPVLWVVFLGAQKVELAGAFFIAAILFCSVIITFTDIDWRVIPDSISMGWLVLAILGAPQNPIWNGLPLQEAYVQSVLGATAAAFVVWACLWIGKMIKQRDVMGWGDVKLMACWGAVLGAGSGTMVFFLAAALATLWILFCFLFKKLRGNDLIPFGPFINIGGVTMLWVQFFLSSTTP